MYKKGKIKIILGLFALVIIGVIGLGDTHFKSLAYDILDSVLVNQDESIISEKSDYQKEGPYLVVKVVDGDTIDLMINSKKERARLIGIDTPETVDPRKKVECFGLEASERAKEILNEKEVYIERDPSQSDRDRYGRLLRYIYLEDGTNVNKKMIEEGFAYEYTYDLPYKYQNEFKEAQERAIEKRAGLWADSVCAIDF